MHRYGINYSDQDIVAGLEAAGVSGASLAQSFFAVKALLESGGATTVGAAIAWLLHGSHDTPAW